MITKKYFSLLLLIIFSTSCVKNIDFEQIDDFTAKPRYIASLVFFKIPASRFLDATGSEIITHISDVTELSIMEEKVIQENLIEAVLDFKIDNPFSRDIYLNIDFFDDLDNITYTINQIKINANTSSFLHKETITIANTPQFLNTRKIRVTLQLSTTAGSPITPADLNEFELKSARTFTLKI